MISVSCFSHEELIPLQLSGEGRIAMSEEWLLSFLSSHETVSQLLWLFSRISHILFNLTMILLSFFSCDWRWYYWNFDCLPPCPHEARGGAAGAESANCRDHMACCWYAAICWLHLLSRCIYVFICCIGEISNRVPVIPTWLKDLWWHLEACQKQALRFVNTPEICTVGLRLRRVFPLASPLWVCCLVIDWCALHVQFQVLLVLLTFIFVDHFVAVAW